MRHQMHYDPVADQCFYWGAGYRHVVEPEEYKTRELFPAKVLALALTGIGLLVIPFAANKHYIRTLQHQAWEAKQRYIVGKLRVLA